MRKRSLVIEDQEDQCGMSGLRMGRPQFVGHQEAW
jgi:hypothetical protein